MKSWYSYYFEHGVDEVYWCNKTGIMLAYDSETDERRPEYDQVVMVPPKESTIVLDWLLKEIK